MVKIENRFIFDSREEFQEKLKELDYAKNALDGEGGFEFISRMTGSRCSARYTPEKDLNAETKEIHKILNEQASEDLSELLRFSIPDSGIDLIRQAIQNSGLSANERVAIDFVENEFPETTGEFKKLILEEYVTFCVKQFDYGSGNISVGSKLETEEEILISLTGLWFRMNDKIQRIFNMVVKKRDLTAANESIEDAWKDLSVYSKICHFVKIGIWGR